MGIVFTFGLTFNPGVNNAIETPKTIGNPVGEMSYSMDCFLSSILDNLKLKIPLVFFRVIFSLLTPVIYIIVFFFIFIFLKLTRIYALTFHAIYTTFIYLFLFL